MTQVGKELRELVEKVLGSAESAAKVDSKPAAMELEPKKAKYKAIRLVINDEDPSVPEEEREIALMRVSYNSRDEIVGLEKSGISNRRKNTEGNKKEWANDLMEAMRATYSKPLSFSRIKRNMKYFKPQDEIDAEERRYGKSHPELRTGG